MGLSERIYRLWPWLLSKLISSRLQCPAHAVLGPNEEWSGRRTYPPAAMQCMENGCVAPSRLPYQQVHPESPLLVPLQRARFEWPRCQDQLD